MKYHYFVSYAYDRGVANCGATLDYLITHVEHVNRLAKIVETRSRYNQVVILNYQLLRTEEEA